jgi:ribonuclease HI
MEPSFLASTHEGKSVALLNAMEWVQHMGLHNIIFVSDTTLLVDAIKLKNVGYSEFYQCDRLQQTDTIFLKVVIFIKK